MKINNIWAVIPAYNEQKNIGNIIKKTKKYVDNIIVVDDGSQDESNQLNELLILNSEKSTEEQKEILLSTFTSWKGKMEQVDDILMIGIRPACIEVSTAPDCPSEHEG